MPGSNKNGAAANKAVVEKEIKLRQELASKLNEKTKDLVNILEDGGVPKDPW